MSIQKLNNQMDKLFNTTNHNIKIYNHNLNITNSNLYNVFQIIKKAELQHIYFFIILMITLMLIIYKDMYLIQKMENIEKKLNENKILV